MRKRDLESKGLEMLHSLMSFAVSQTNLSKDRGKWQLISNDAYYS